VSDLKYDTSGYYSHRSTLDSSQSLTGLLLVYVLPQLNATVAARDAVIRSYSATVCRRSPMRRLSTGEPLDKPLLGQSQCHCKT
jgi:hypothetical protein